MLFTIINLLRVLIRNLFSDRVLGELCYHYESVKNAVAPILGGRFSFLPWKVSSPRKVEYKWVLNNLKQIRDKGRKRLLDIGCANSYIPYKMLRLGFDVYGIDIKPYILDNPSFKYFICDITKTIFPNEYFDVITAISTLEHIGLGAYGDPIYHKGDFLAVKEISRILKPEGYLFVTIPYSYEYTVTWQRIYDWKSISKLFNNSFIIIKAEFFAPTARFLTPSKDYFYGGGKWIAVTKEEAEQAARLYGRSTACLLLKKKIL